MKIENLTRKQVHENIKHVKGNRKDGLVQSVLDGETTLFQQVEDSYDGKETKYSVEEISDFVNGLDLPVERLESDDFQYLTQEGLQKAKAMYDKGAISMLIGAPSILALSIGSGKGLGFLFKNIVLDYISQPNLIELIEKVGENAISGGIGIMTGIGSFIFGSKYIVNRWGRDDENPIIKAYSRLKTLSSEADEFMGEYKVLEDKGLINDRET